MRVARLTNLRECKSDGLGVSCTYPLELQPHATKHDCTVRENKRAPRKKKDELSTPADRQEVRVGGKIAI